MTLGDGGASTPRRADVVAAYDLGVDAYLALWSPVILPPAREVVAALRLEPGARVLDLGTGTGALVPSLQRAAAEVAVVGLDAAYAMLRVARDTTRVPAVQGDATWLPFRQAAVDAALLAFMLFHLADPGQALREVVRVLVAGGRVGTVTWVREEMLDAHRVWDAVLTEAGAPAPPTRRVDTGLDSADALDELLSASELDTTSIWSRSLSHTWDASTYWRLAAGSGVNRLRLQHLEPAERADTLEIARRRLTALRPDAFAWTGEVLCAVATKSNPGRSVSS